MSKQRSEKSLASAFDSFNTRVADLGASYRDLKTQIERLNLEISEKNLQLEDNFFEVNRIRLFFDSILNSMTDGVIVIDTAGVVALFNKGAENLTGVPAQKAIGRHYSDVISGKVSKRFSPLYTLQSGKPLFHEEKEIHVKNGRIVPVRYSTSLVQDNAGNILGAVEVFSDLTSIKNLEDEMQQVRTQAALNQMAILVSHEIRNPLGGIRGYVDLIAESFEDDDPRKKMINHIIDSVSRLDAIVSKFQIYTRPVRPHFVSTDIMNFLADVAEFFTEKNALDEKGIRIKQSNKCGKAVFCHVDPILMEQVALAIFDNSVKSMKNGGTIRIELNNQATRLAGRECVSVVISDSGAGMESSVCKQALVPFFTTREKGLGLGLALASNFIKLHHGRITIESEQGIGTTVTILLPMN